MPDERYEAPQRNVVGVVVGRQVHGVAISRLVIGIVVVSLGVIFLLDELGIANASNILRYWPAILLAYGLMRLTGTWCTQQSTAGLIFTLIGGWMLLRSLGVLPFGLRDFWPLILIAVGVMMVAGGLGRGRRAAGNGDPSNTIHALAFWSGIDRKIVSQDFQGGDITAIMGGHQLDFRAAKIAGGVAEIDMLVMMGGVDMRIPEDWALAVEAVPIMGGIEDRTRPPAGEVKGRLVLKGFVMMGGVEVKN
jgi:predicted membrane protein